MNHKISNTEFNVGKNTGILTFSDQQKIDYNQFPGSVYVATIVHFDKRDKMNNRASLRNPFTSSANYFKGKILQLAVCKSAGCSIKFFRFKN